MRSFVQILGVQIQRKRTHGKFKYRGTENSLDFMFQYRETAILVVCYLNLEEQQPWNCVIQIQRNGNDGSVLFKYRGTTVLEVCYSNTEEQQ